MASYQETFSTGRDGPRKKEGFPFIKSCHSDCVTSCRRSLNGRKRFTECRISSTLRPLDVSGLPMKKEPVPQQIMSSLIGGKATALVFLSLPQPHPSRPNRIRIPPAHPLRRRILAVRRLRDPR